MIRKATNSDIPRIVEMGLRFLRESPYKQKLGENAEQITALTTQLVEMNQVLVSEKDGQLTGMLGFILFPHPMSGELTAGEVVWWVDPERRGEGKELLRETERLAKEAGAVKMQMIAPDERVGILYRRLGYEQVEVTYQRTL